MADRRTHVPSEIRAWVERFEGTNTGLGRVISKRGVEATLEMIQVGEASAILHRIDPRRTPWAGNADLKAALYEARGALSTLRDLLEEEMFRGSESR